jgi:hypothetical protein
MKGSLLTIGIVLLLANVTGWALGAATSTPIGAVLSIAILLAVAGGWLLVAGASRRPERVPVRSRRGRR